MKVNGQLHAPAFLHLGRLGGPQGRSGRCGVEKNLLPLPESNPGRRFRSLSLYRLSYPGSLVVVVVVVVLVVTAEAAAVQPRQRI
jgi:hypothetical protein